MSPNFDRISGDDPVSSPQESSGNEHRDAFVPQDSPDVSGKSPESAPRRESTIELAVTLFTLDQLQDYIPDAPQLALAGRSNVGKSSLLNVLARRRQLAKVSSTPGKTRSVNLFRVVPEGFFLTDLPGYGYARRGKEERRLWGTLIENYLTKSPLLKAVIVLLDCRLPPQEVDKQMVAFGAAHGLTLLPILTKADKCNQRERASRQKEWAMFLHGQLPLPVSARTGLGINALWDRLRAAALAE